MGKREIVVANNGCSIILLLLTFSSIKALDPAVNANETFQFTSQRKCLHLCLGNPALAVLNAAVHPHA